MEIGGIDIGSWATAYAAVVATIVGGVQIWQQLRSGPRLIVSVSPNISIIPGNEVDQDMIGVTVINRGTAPTTIESLTVAPRKSRPFRRNSEKDICYFIKTPQPSNYPATLPKVLNPGDKWQGFIRLGGGSPNFRNGNFIACISSTMHRDPVRAPIPKAEIE